MKILGIETSCDETAAAIVSDGKTILSSVVASSQRLHNKTGGVIPEIAAREQIRCIMPVIHEAMQKAKSELQNLDAIAVTVGPGLIGSLLVGVETAKTIAFIYQKPIIPVNHIFAHIYANFLEVENGPIFPAIALVVSGGHTELFFMKNNREMQWIGGTLDDAAGEAFDKTARLLELEGYPGGPAIAAAAEQFIHSHPEFISGSKKMLKPASPPPAGRAGAGRQVQHDVVKLPRPMIDSKDLNFSFSGLKTAVIREVNRMKTMKQFDNETTRLPARQVQQLAFEIQEAITDVLVKKTLDAAMRFRVKSILLGGGVAANKRLTKKFILEIKNLKLKIDLHVPPPKLCTDNASYIASYGYFHNHPIPWKDVAAQPDMDVEVGNL